MPGKERNRAIDILRATAIVLVVIGHMFPVPGCEWWQSHFPAGSYRLALFLFISGYLFRDMKIADFPGFIGRKTKNLLVPLIGWNIVYACIVSLINLRHPAEYLPPTAQIWIPHNLFIEPFVTGHQYLLNLATWFVGLLYLALLLYSLVYLATKRVPAWVMLIFYAGIAALSLWSASFLPHSGIWLVVMRIGYALYFIQLGAFFRIYIEPLLDARHLWWWLLVLAAAWCAVTYGEGRTFIWLFFNFNGGIARSIAAGTLGCLFWMNAAKQIALIVPKNRIETAVSNGTWSIMTNHLLVRFMFCWTFVHFFADEAIRTAFSGDFWYFPRSNSFLSGYTLIYLLALVLEISLPVLWQLYFDKFKDLIRSKFSPKQ